MSDAPRELAERVEAIRLAQPGLQTFGFDLGFAPARHVAQNYP